MTEVGEVTWSDFTLQFDGNEYEIPGGTTDKKYIWWDYSNPDILQTTDDKSEMESRMMVEDCLVAINDDGYHRQMIPTATLIHGGSLRTESITAEEIKAGTITAEKIDVRYWYTENLVFTDNTPSASYVAWSACTLYWEGSDYDISSGNTNNEYIWWEEGDGVFTTGNTKPTLTVNDCLIAINIDGTAHPVLNNTLIHGGSIKTGTITATEIEAETITGNEIHGTTITADKMSINDLADIKEQLTVAGGTVVIDSSGVTIKGAKLTLKDSGGNHSNQLYVDTSGALRLDGWGALNTKTIYPLSDNSWSLGSSGETWAWVYANKLQVDNYIAAQGANYIDLPRRTSNPSSYECRVYYNTNEHRIMYYDGSSWQKVGHT